MSLSGNPICAIPHHLGLSNFIIAITARFQAARLYPVRTMRTDALGRQECRGRDGGGNGGVST